jgi:phenylacetate-CoA ligase
MVDAYFELFLIVDFLNMLPRRSLAAWETFVNTSLTTHLDDSVNINPEQTVLELFRDVSANVPAYQNWLRQQGISPEDIQTFTDFQSLPLLTKSNYIKAYSLSDLCREGKIESCDFIAVSSGSTGQPTFWPRFLTNELDIARRFERIFRDSFQAHRGKTLAVVCFTLGTWVGGIYSANCCRHLAAKGYPITVVTPGNNPTEIFRVVRELAPLFDRVVLLGYPPFLKDIIDRGMTEGINWQDYAVKLVMAGEVFSEEWRSLVCSRIGSTNPCYDVASLYGTADAGVLGNETPLTICIRRFLAENPTAARELFGESRLPTLVEYDPLSRFFETHDNTLLFSGDNGVPLIRYHIADRGGIISYAEMEKFLADWNFNAIAELNLSEDSQIYRLPFVYIFGRSNFIVSYYGANIYPENIQVGLEQNEVSDWVTGKFVMEIKFDRDNNAYLAIAVELAPNLTADSDKPRSIAASILAQLLRLNSEYANYVPAEKQLPKITLFLFGDPEYFSAGVKHRYTR